MFIITSDHCERIEEEILRLLRIDYGYDISDHELRSALKRACAVIGIPKRKHQRAFRMAIERLIDRKMVEVRSVGGTDYFMAVDFLSMLAKQI